MGRNLVDCSFEEWVRHVFDHPVTDSEWYFAEDADRWEGSSELTVDYITRLFEQAGSLLSPYSDGQLNQGFWYLVHTACSDHMFALFDSRVAWPARRRCVQAIGSLFASCFASRCGDHLTDEAATPLSSACYMWWDLFPCSPPGPPQAVQALEADTDQVNRECLAVTQRILELPSAACQESALHGLGHYYRDYPEIVDRSIGDFLLRHPDICSELKKYASAARDGNVQ